jgi:phosphoglucosamine mutase
MTRFPQVLLNLKVKSKPDVSSLPTVAKLIADAERTLGERGRVLVRYSGTEALLRVMIEGEREPEIRTMAERIVEAARAAIGAP